MSSASVSFLTKGARTYFVTQVGMVNFFHSIWELLFRSNETTKPKVPCHMRILFVVDLFFLLSKSISIKHRVSIVSE